MEKIQFDSGVREFDLGGGVLRFNPSDPNIYARFLEAGDKLRALETELAGMDALQGLRMADDKMKAVLSWVFGGENDFALLLEGVSLLSVGENGKSLVENLLEALQPVLLTGAESCMQSLSRQAVQAAKSRRDSL